MAEENHHRDSDFVINELSRDFKEFVRESKRDRIERDRKIVCLHDSFEKFRDTHEPTLTQIAEMESRRKKLREAIIDKVASSAIWAAIVAVGSAVWYAAKTFIKT